MHERPNPHQAGYGPAPATRFAGRPADAPAGHPAEHPAEHPGGHPGGHPDAPEDKPAGHPGSHPGHVKKTLDDGTPACRLIAWEVTRSCNLACKHCRAEARLDPYPGELTTEEAMALIDTFPEVGSPIVIFTGGEPLLREDVFTLAAKVKQKGLRPVMAPNGTLVTAQMVQKMLDAGIERCSLSLDGPTAALHDEFRGVAGSFDAVMKAIGLFNEAGMEFQVNTTVTRDNLPFFRDIFELCRDKGAKAWHIFLLVPTGRAEQIRDQVITDEEYEKVLNWFYDFQKTTDMQLKATCAPHYHRILRQRARQDNIPVTFENFGLDAVSRGCLGGTGFCFISHTGQVQPCGYLELDCGQVKSTPFPEIWRNSEQFLNLRDPGTYTGKCGACEYERVCGGCRARAQTMRGHYLDEEPLCSYTPRKLR